MLKKNDTRTEHVQTLPLRSSPKPHGLTAVDAASALLRALKGEMMERSLGRETAQTAPGILCKCSIFGLVHSEVFSTRGHQGMGTSQLQPWEFSAGWLEVGAWGEQGRFCTHGEPVRRIQAQQRQGSEESEGSHRRTRRDSGRDSGRDPRRAGWLSQPGVRSLTSGLPLPPSPQAVPVDLSRRERALVGGGAPGGLGPTS